MKGHVTVGHQPLYIMLVGFPGSGKSYLARKFMAEWIKYSNRPIAHLSTDSIIEEEAAKQGLTYNDVFATTIGAAVIKFEDRCRELLSKDTTLVIDRTNLTIGSRARLLESVPKHYQKIAILVSCDEALRQSRLLERTDKSIPKDHAEKMLAHYTPPSEAEGFDLVLTSEYVYKTLLP